MLVPAGRLVRWFENFGTRHGAPAMAVHEGRLVATAPDGAVAEAADAGGTGIGCHTIRFLTQDMDFLFSKKTAMDVETVRDEGVHV